MYLRNDRNERRHPKDIWCTDKSIFAHTFKESFFRILVWSMGNDAHTVIICHHNDGGRICKYRTSYTFAIYCCDYGRQCRYYYNSLDCGFVRI